MDVRYIKTAMVQLAEVPRVVSLFYQIKCVSLHWVITLMSAGRSFIGYSRCLNIIQKHKKKT